jgi:hypothetical protein
VKAHLERAFGIDASRLETAGRDDRARTPDIQIPSGVPKQRGRSGRRPVRQTTRDQAEQQNPQLIDVRRRRHPKSRSRSQ